MSGVKMRITANDKAVVKFLSNLEKKLNNLTPVYKKIGNLVVNSSKENFRQGGRPETWIPLADSTLLKLMGGKQGSQKKRGKGTQVKAVNKLADKKTLIESKRLMNSITYNAMNDNVNIGTNVVYGAIHQLGGQAGRGLKANIPARPYLMVQDGDWEDIFDVINDHFEV
jgi:phage virion morphogenesis protein